MDQFTLGIDFGTESARIIAVNISTGQETGKIVWPYADGVITDVLPQSSQWLKPDWALQNPADYQNVIFHGIPELVAKIGMNSGQIIGIGVAFTSCTVLPVDEHGTPLCFHETFHDHPHSWPKLWKHHSAVKEAALLERALQRHDPRWLTRYGGHVSVEWLWPKLFEILHEDPAIFDATDRMVEGADWIVYQLTGRWSRNIGGAGFKAFYQPDLGAVEDCWADTEPQLANARSKLRGPIVPIGAAVGTLSPHVAEQVGLAPTTVVAAGMIDAHAAVLGVGAIEPGSLTIVMGTSTCHLIMEPTRSEPEGIFGVVKDGLMPTVYAYEAGQAAVGDVLKWVADLTQNHFMTDETPYTNLEHEAATILPGATGLLALEWWNGNRSVLGDPKLSGVLVGLRLDSTPADIYRALMEATAFGTRRILDAWKMAGMACERVVACGGLPHKSGLLVQIYADILGQPVEVAASAEATALGVAIAAAAAAGPDRGGYATLEDAVRVMVSPARGVVAPQETAREPYDIAYAQYLILHDWFGRTHPDVMHTLQSNIHKRA